MGPWHAFFTLNRTILLFAYGQVFFLLGLAIIWQTRRHSRLDLASSLGWLGAFGLIHGLHEWGDIFIPIQAEYLHQAWIETLRMIQVCLLAFSLACLFQFGVETLGPLYPRLRGIQILPGGLLIVWALAFLWTSQVAHWESNRLLVHANVWARYLLAFPGALAAALGLVQQARLRPYLREFPRIGQSFQAAGVTLVSYAILAGLFVPAAPFFPASVVNSEASINLLGLPIQVLRSLAGLALTVSVVRGLEIFEVELERRIEDMERAQILLAERERVGRELHDGAIQTVYTAGLIAQSIRNKMGADPQAARMDRVIAALNHAIQDLRHFVAALEPGAPGESLVGGLTRLAKDPDLQSLIDVEVSIACDEDGQFSPARVTHVLAIVNEALSNVARHAQTRHASLAADRRDDQLHVMVSDDGIGLPGNYRAGFGLRNMHDRARLLGGTLHIERRLPRGTQVVLTIPWDDLR